MDVEEKVNETVRKYGMLSHGEGILVAVSGGPDSVALLHLLTQLGKSMSLRLEVAHLQHGMRGEEAHEDARFVAGIAERMKIPFHLREIDVPGLKSKERGNLEALARRERYRVLLALSEERDLGKVATGHTRDDQVETVLMWLLRGAGRKGLGGMPPLRELGAGRVTLIRPLIEVSREELAGYLAENGIRYRVDSTNLDPQLLRNWLRLGLLPQIRAKLGSGVDGGIARAAEIVREEEEILREVARGRLEQASSGEDLLCSLLLKEGKAIQRRMIRLWLERALGELRGLSFHHVEEVLRFVAQGPPQGRLSIRRGWDLVKSYDVLRLEEKTRRGKARPYDYALPLEGELVIPEAGFRMTIERRSFSGASLPADGLEAVFDPASLPEPLVVRNFRPGDRFQPLGMKGHKKVKDLFIEKKVPSSVRAALPLLVAGREVLWIPNCGRSDIAKVGPRTKEILRLKVLPFPR